MAVSKSITGLLTRQGHSAIVHYQEGDLCLEEIEPRDRQPTVPGRGKGKAATLPREGRRDGLDIG